MQFDFSKIPSLVNEELMKYGVRSSMFHVLNDQREPLVIC